MPRLGHSLVSGLGSECSSQESFYEDYNAVLFTGELMLFMGGGVNSIHWGISGIRLMASIGDYPATIPTPCTIVNDVAISCPEVLICHPPAMPSQYWSGPETKD